MPLKFKLGKIDEVEEKYRPLYVERDGAFFLDVGDVVPKDKLEEFRANNVELTKKLQSYDDRFKDVDPVKARALIEAERKEQEKLKIDAGKIDEVVADRVKELTKEKNKKISELETSLTTATTRLTVLTIDNEVIAHATKKGIQPTAVTDITERARKVFRLEGDKPAAYVGDQKQFGKDGLTPLSIEEWVEKQVNEAPHLFVQNKGSGGGGNGKINGLRDGEANPFLPMGKGGNLTRRMVIMKENPALAEELRKAAEGK